MDDFLLANALGTAIKSQHAKRLPHVSCSRAPWPHCRRHRCTEPRGGPLPRSAKTLHCAQSRQLTVSSQGNSLCPGLTVSRTHCVQDSLCPGLTVSSQGNSLCPGLTVSSQGNSLCPAKRQAEPSTRLGATRATATARHTRGAAPKCCSEHTHVARSMRLAHACVAWSTLFPVHL